jgi:hypothetical protein
MFLLDGLFLQRGYVMPDSKKTSQKESTATRAREKVSSHEAGEEREQLAQLVAAHNVVQGRESPSPANIIALQKTVGNQAVQRFLDQRSTQLVNVDEGEAAFGEQSTNLASGASPNPSQSGKGKREAAMDADEEDKVKKEAAMDADEEDKVKKEVSVFSDSTASIHPQTRINWELPSVEHVAGDTRQDDKTKSEVSWAAADYSSSSVNGSSTCVEKPFKVTYTDAEVENGWRLKVSSVTGGATITVKTGGSTNPITDTPETEVKSKEAVKVMKGYHKLGRRGKWHTEAASKDHELYHYKEWKETCNHYWPTAQKAIEELTVSKSEESEQSKARTKLETAADKIVKKFKDVSWAYWFTLGDGAGDRPYAAGQLKLNEAIEYVQEIAEWLDWTVEEGVNTPNTANPCYQPWKPFNP